MRFIFKTTYQQDIQLAKHGGHIFWYGLLLLLLFVAPWLVPEYWLAQLSFVMIYSIIGLGLMLLAGFTGLFSIGNAAFMGVGAYVAGVMSVRCTLSAHAVACRGAVCLGRRGGRIAGIACEGHFSWYRHLVIRLHCRRGVGALGKSDGW